MISTALRVESGGKGEDRVLVERVFGGAIVIVCDGAGNSGKGGQAADRAIGELARMAKEGFVDWRRALLAVDQLLLKEVPGGETTCVAVRVTDSGECVGASAGDSGAWMLPASRPPEELTRLQSRERLGSGQANPVLFKAQLMGRLVIGTDGLLKYTHLKDLRARALRGVDALVEGVRLPGGGFQDDVTAVIVD